MVAQPAGAQFLFANRKADRLNRNTPPVRPVASRTTQKPSVLRPMKNSGIDSLRTPPLGRRGKFVTAALPPITRQPLRLASKLIIASHQICTRQ